MRRSEVRKEGGEEKKKERVDARVFIASNPCCKRVIIITEDNFNIWSIIVLRL